MIELLTDPHAWAALVTLTVLEIVLGIDNVIFISVLVSRCSPEEAKRARQIGLSLALIFRIILLGALTWLMGLTQPMVTLFGMGISWRDIILIGGGLLPDRQGDARDPRRGRSTATRCLTARRRSIRRSFGWSSS